MSYEDEAEFLKALSPPPQSISELAKKLHRRTATVVLLTKEMEEQGLLEVKTEKSDKKGRPRHIIKPTTLGEDYLVTYEELKLKPLRGRKADLRKAATDAEYAERLVSRGLSPIHLFLELNTLVRANTRRPA